LRFCTPVKPPLRLLVCAGPAIPHKIKKTKNLIHFLADAHGVRDISSEAMGNPKKDQHKTKNDQRSWFERVMGAIRKETTEYVTDVPVVKTVNGALSGAKALDRYLPSMHVMCGSVSDNVAFAARFGAIASTVGIGVCIVSAYQGVQALNLIATHLKNISDEVKVLCTLKAMEVVPVMIHNFISEGLTKDFNIVF
jgi:hypothetical protein